MLYPWQQRDWSRLNGEMDRFPNAWLLTGQSGIGKRRFAEHIAQSLLCDSPDEQGSCCYQCGACRWYLAGNHPDFRLLSPLRDGGEGLLAAKALRQLPLIKIEAVREVIEALQLSSHCSRWRVVLIDPADALHVAATNALLKTLEEPPTGVLFLLVSAAPQRLLLTIRSRCREFALTAPTHAEALAWLTQQAIVNPEVELAHHGGTPLFDYDPNLALFRRKFLDHLSQLSVSAVLTLAEQIEKQALPLLLPLQWLQRWVFDLLGWQLSKSVRYYPDYQSALDSLSQRANTQQLFRFQQYLIELRPFVHHTLNLRLQLEAMLLEYLSAVLPPRRS